MGFFSNVIGGITHFAGQVSGTVSDVVSAVKPFAQYIPGASEVITWAGAAADISTQVGNTLNGVVGNNPAQLVQAAATPVNQFTGANTIVYVVGKLTGEVTKMLLGSAQMVLDLGNAYGPFPTYEAAASAVSAAGGAEAVANANVHNAIGTVTDTPRPTSNGNLSGLTNPAPVSALPVNASPASGATGGTKGGGVLGWISNAVNTVSNIVSGGKGGIGGTGMSTGVPVIDAALGGAANGVIDNLSGTKPVKDFTNTIADNVAKNWFEKNFPYIAGGAIALLLFLKKRK